MTSFIRYCCTMYPTTTCKTIKIITWIDSFINQIQYFGCWNSERKVLKKSFYYHHHHCYSTRKKNFFFWKKINFNTLYIRYKWTAAFTTRKEEKTFQSNQINSIPLTIQWLSIYILLKDNVWRLSSNDFANHTIISFWYSIQIHFKRKKNLVIFIDQKSITLCVYNCKKDRRMSSLSFSSIERYSIFVPINMVIVFNDLFPLKIND